MELMCAVLFALLSLLSVKGTPHGYGVKGGARAEAGAVAGAISGVGLPLSISSGPGFSGSFSKSSSSSFASSSASSSSSSFSFSGSGASGFGPNSLGTPGSAGCTGGCHGSQSVTNGINDSHGTGSAANGLQSFSGAKAQAAAGAYAGSLGGSTNGPCTSGVCSGQKSPCEGPNCKETSESCKSGQCGSKPSSETTLPDRDHEDCALGQCGVDSESAPDGDSLNCKNGNCSTNPEKTSYASSNDQNCASGQCVSGSPSSPATGNIPSDDKCTSGKCADELPAPAPGKDYESNDIPVSVSSTSTASHNSDHHLSNSGKETTSTLQSDGTDCKYGNCASPSLNAKPYAYSGSNTYNPNQPQNAAPGVRPSINKPATHLTAPKQDAACTYPNCPRPEEPSLLTPGKKDCTGENCDSGPSNKYPSPNNGYSEPQNEHYPSGSPSSQCNSPNCYTGNDESKLEKPSAPGNCAAGNCGDSSIYQPNYDIQVSKIPIHSQGSVNSTNCASGNCEKSPVPPDGTGTLKPSISSPPPSLLCAFGPCDDKNYHTDSSYPRLPSYPQNIQPNKPLNCASGNCPNYPTSSATPVGSKFPFSSGQPSAVAASSCASGNCGSSPTYQHGSFGSAGFQNPSYSGANPALSPHHSLDQTGSKFPIPHGQPPVSGSPSCASGRCEGSPTYQHGTFGFSGVQSSAFSGANPPVNCASGNCPNYQLPQPNAGLNGPKFPIPHGQHSVSGSPVCTSGNCGSSPAYQHGTFGSSGFQKPSYSSATPAASPQPSPDQSGSKLPIQHGQPSISASPGCTSGNCGSIPAYQHGNYGSSGFQGPSYSGASPAINCASGNCPNYPAPQYSAESKFPITPGKPSVSGSPGCTSGTCGSNPAYQHGSFGSSGFQSPSYSGVHPSSTCASGNCATYPTQSGVVASGPNIPSHTGPIGQVPSGSPVSSGSGTCASGICPSQPSTSSSASKPSDKFPDYVALGVAGGATKPTSTGLFVPSSIPSSQPGTGSLTPTISGVTGEVHAQPPEVSPFNNDKEQLYTGGFGGPPGILKPYEFKAPTPNLASNNKNKEPHCATGKCDPQSGGDVSSNTHAHGSGPCTSGNCGPQSGKPHHGQTNALSGAFTGAAATVDSDAAVYTGGFGGPPGVLKPYDEGKIGHSAAISGAKHTTALGGNYGHASGNKLNNAFGAQSGAAAIANGGAFGSGNYGGEHNKAGGCDSGCGTSGHGSFGGDFGLAGGITKTGLLEKLHNGAQSVSSATRGAGASSFAVGGSFASSSASAHSLAGSATKGGYGR